MKTGKWINPFSLETLTELFEHQQKESKRTRFGPWKYCKKTDHLVHTAAPIGHRKEYAVPVSQLRRLSLMQDWLCHLSSKTWMTPEDLGWLVKAMVHFGIVQYVGCQGGQEK